MESSITSSLVLADEAHLDAERHAEGQPQGPAFVGGVARLGKFVADVFEAKVAVVAFDREDFASKSLEPFVFAFGGLDIFLKESLIGLDLDVDQIGDWAARRRAC